MKPAPFEYFAPDTLEEALALLSEHGFDAKVLAGGQSLVPTMNFRLAQPGVLIDLNRIQGLSYIRPDRGAELHIGCLTRHAELERSAVISEKAPLIFEAMPHIAHSQIRNRGTIGGSLVHADPAAELPALMTALDARFLLRSQSGERWVQAQEFFVDLFTTVLESEEILTEVVVPELPQGSGCAFQEVARRHGDFALVGVAAAVTLDQQGKCEDARIVLLSVGNGPVPASLAQQCLVGEKPVKKLLREAAEIAAEKDIDPPADMHASAAFRRHLARVLTEQALTRACARAG